jgi:hypothetical protein
LIVDRTVKINAIVKSLKTIIAVQFRSDGCKTLHHQNCMKKHSRKCISVSTPIGIIELFGQSTQITHEIEITIISLK